MNVTELLKQHGLKKTPTRVQVLEVYGAFSYALSVSDMEAKLGDDFDRVTLYRTLSTFEDKGLLHKVFDDDGKVKYSLCSAQCSEQHHHDNHLHFHCRKCKKTTCLERIPVAGIKDLEGFIVQDIYMLANGICKNCA